MCLVIDLSHANVSRGEYLTESKKVYVNHIFILSTVIKVSLKFFNRFYFFFINSIQTYCEEIRFRSMICAKF